VPTRPPVITSRAPGSGAVRRSLNISRQADAASGLAACHVVNQRHYRRLIFFARLPAVVQGVVDCSAAFPVI
jgi:hypothetical protein